MSETNTQSGQTQQTDDLANELNRLGENLGKILKSTWASEERKSVERELRSGLEQFNRQINKAIEQTRAEQNIKKARHTVEDMWQTAHGPQVFREMRLGIVDSLHRVNDELAKRAEPKPAQEVKPTEPPKQTQPNSNTEDIVQP